MMSTGKRKAYDWLRKPKKGVRATFALCIRGKTYNPPELVQINEAFRKGTITFDEAEKACRDLLDAGKPAKRSTSTGNLEIFNTWWAKEKLTRNRKDLQTAENDYLRALSFLGTISVFHSDRDLIALKFKSLDNPVQRRLIGRINEIRGPELRIPLPSKKQTNPAHLFIEQVEQVVEKLPNLADFIWTLFGTGARVGEAIGMETILQGNVIPIDRAWVRPKHDKGGHWALPKRDKKRTVPTIGQARPYIKQWLERSEDERKAFVNVRASDTITRVCKELFPNKPEHHCDFHDLRHSYALHCVSKGMSMRDISLALGDRIDTVEEYYLGFQIRLQEALKFSKALD